MSVPVPVGLLVPLLAQAGGGSAGFGGGGGGGGGGFGGGGGDGEGGGDFGAAAIVVVFFVLLFAAIAGVRWFRARRREARRASREQEVRRRAAEAAQDDPSLDPDQIRLAAAELFRAVQAAWDARDRDGLAVLLGDDLLEEWRRRLDDFDRKGWRSRAVVEGRPAVRLVGMVDREGTDEDRVVVFVSCPMKVWVRGRDGEIIGRKGGSGPHLELEQYWTLGTREGSWILLSIEEEAEGRHHLDAAVVATPGDDPALVGATRIELAVDDATPASAGVARLHATTFADDARAAALDLSLVDDRFSPDVLEAAARQIVDAWSAAVDGDDAELERRSSPEAVQALLWGEDEERAVRTVVRGLAIDAVEIVGLGADAVPPTMRVRVAWRGAWYREDRATQAVAKGSRERTTRRTELWTLALTDDRVVPWRLITVRT